jgi:hypothetical protein
LLFEAQGFLNAIEVLPSCMFQHMLAYAAEVVEIVCRLVAAGKSKKVTGLL